MSYFDFENVRPDLILNHMKNNGEFLLESFLQNSLQINIPFKQNAQEDQIELLKHLCDFIARALLKVSNSTKSEIDNLQKDKLVALKQSKELRSSMEMSQKNISQKPKGIDLKEMIKVNKNIVKLQSWVRMFLVHKRLRKQNKNKNQQQSSKDNNRELVGLFVQQLKSRKLTPEEFFRSIDIKKSNNIAADIFIQILLDKKIFTNRQQATRFSFLIDEDFSGDITFQELQKTLKAYQFNIEQNADQKVTIEHKAIIKVISILQKKKIGPNELFNAIDLDNSEQITLDELKKFINSIVNTQEPGSLKTLLDKELIIFMNILDIDKNNIVTRGEFLKQYTKLESLAQKLLPLYQKEVQFQQQNAQLQDFQQTEQETIQIIRKMQKEGIDFVQLIHLLQTQGETTDTIKLGPLLRQLQLSYPTVSLDQLRQVLKNIRIDNGKYNIMEFQMLLLRYQDETFKPNSIYQTLLVLVEILKQKQVDVDQFMAQAFSKQELIEYESFNQVLIQMFSLPQESIVTLFNTMLIDSNQKQVNKNDFIDVLNSFYFDNDKISINNLSYHIKNYQTLSPIRRKQFVINLVNQKLNEKKLQPLSVYNIAQKGTQAQKAQIIQAFNKLIPQFTNDIINMIMPNETYNKQQFLDAFKVDQDLISREENQKNSRDIIKVLDQALLQANMSPAYLFQKADLNNNGKVDIVELKNVLKQLTQELNERQKFQIDDITIKQIITELDVNGNGVLEEQEFYNLIKLSRSLNNQQTNVLQPIDLTNRCDLLPTKQNLAKIQPQITTQQININTLNINQEDINNILKEIEKITSFKGSLCSCKIDHNLNISLRDLSTILKQKGVPIQTLGSLQRILDSKNTGNVSVHQLIQICNEFLIKTKSPLYCNIEFNLICKIISLDQKSLSVEDYFQKNSDKRLLGTGTQLLVQQVVDREFQRLFKLPSTVNIQITELIKNTFHFGLDKLLNKHLYMYFQQIYDQHNPNDKSLTQIQNQQLQTLHKSQKTTLQSENIQQSKQVSQKAQDLLIMEENTSQMLLKNFIIQVLGKEAGALNLKDILAENGFPFDISEISFQDFYQIFVEKYQLINLNDSKIIFTYILEMISGGNQQMKERSVNLSNMKTLKISSLDFMNFIHRAQQSVQLKEIKQMTLQMESYYQDLVELIVKNISFTQSGKYYNKMMMLILGMISKYSLGKSLIQSFNGKMQPYEIRFVLNTIDKDNDKLLEIDELQEYFKIYTSKKQISISLYFKYFAYKLDSEFRKTSTNEAIKLNPQLLQSNPSQQKIFVDFIMLYFSHPKKSECIMDLYDYISTKIDGGESSKLQAIISYLYSQIDSYRTTIVPSQKYLVRNNDELRDYLIREMLKQRQNFPIYKIMDDLVFSEDGIIPVLTLKHHLKKLYPYIEESKIQLFVTLVDINFDQKIEIYELFRFFNEIYGKEMNYNTTLQKVAQIVYSTNETLESFFIIHQVEINKIAKNLKFQQFVQAISHIFKISKYESYIIFVQLKIKDQDMIDFRAFVDCVKGQLKRLELQDKDKNNENQQLEEKIKNYKNTMSQKIMAKLMQIKQQNQEEQENKQSEDNSLHQSLQSQNTSTKLSNSEILKIYIDNYKEICTFSLVKGSCLKLQSLIKTNAKLRSQLFTRRVCTVQEMYYELDKDEKYFGTNNNENFSNSLRLLESEKIVLAVLAMEVVSKTYECNIYKFKQLIMRINESTELDFQMLLKILDQRYQQINELLYEGKNQNQCQFLDLDFITIQVVIEKIRNQVQKYGKQVELQFKEETQFQEFLNVLSSILNITFRPKEIVQTIPYSQIFNRLISRELKISKDNHNIKFQQLKLFLAQCNIKIKLKESINLIYSTLEQAQAGLSILKQHLISHPYLNLNDSLVILDSGQPIQWNQFSSQKQIAQQLSPIHSNRVLIDCIQQMNADQMDQQDHIKKLIIHEDVSGEIQLIIVKLNNHYIICDKLLPWIKNDKGENQALFTYDINYPALHYIEKALAIIRGGYQNLKIITNVYQIFQILNYNFLESYNFNDKLEQFKGSYQNLLDNFFVRSIMRHFYFTMPQKKKANPLSLGLEGGRVYAVIGFIQLKIDSKTTHNLAVVYNPYINEDPRKSGEMWGKVYLNNTKKNKKIIDCIVQTYGQEVYDFIADKNSNVYTYDFLDIFDSTTEDKDLQVYLLYKLNEQGQEIQKQRFTLYYDMNQSNNIITISAPIVDQKDRQTKINNAFGFIHFNLEGVSKYSFTMTKSQGQINDQVEIQREKYGQFYSKTLYIEFGQEIQLQLQANANKEQLSQIIEHSITLYYQQNVPLKIQVPQRKRPQQQTIQEEQKLKEDMKKEPTKVISKELKQEEIKQEVNDEEYDDEYESEDDQQEIHEKHDLQEKEYKKPEINKKMTNKLESNNKSNQILKDPQIIQKQITQEGQQANTQKQVQAKSIKTLEVQSQKQYQSENVQDLQVFPKTNDKQQQKQNLDKNQNYIQKQQSLQSTDQKQLVNQKSLKEEKKQPDQQLTSKLSPQKTQELKEQASTNPQLLPVQPKKQLTQRKEDKKQ